MKIIEINGSISLFEIYKIGIEDGTSEKLVECFIKSAEIVFITRGGQNL